ncbi:unnamed protein product [Brachionus calyciflorus]|uniref:Uncharacterized protein n=1 Tax=Brachionus calyciflorus TaxID=104777 RepID=A0A813W659_9BILA|nr:unnamed protein product [Brachionus calyciflorus]
MSQPIIDESNILDLFLDYIQTNRSEVSQLFADLQYQGFNAFQFRKMVLKKIQDQKLSIRDLIHVLNVYIVLGTNLNKIQKKSSDKDLAVFNNIKTKLSIKFEASSKLGPNDITLSRLSAAFPDFIAEIIKKKNDIVDLMGHDINPCYCFPTAASLLDRSDEDSFETWCKWAFDFSKKINPKYRSLSAPNDVIKRYWRISFESNLFSDVERKKVRDKVGAINAKPTVQIDQNPMTSKQVQQSVTQKSIHMKELKTETPLSSVSEPESSRIQTETGKFTKSQLDEVV